VSFDHEHYADMKIDLIAPLQNLKNRQESLSDSLSCMMLLDCEWNFVMACWLHDYVGVQKLAYTAMGRFEPLKLAWIGYAHPISLSTTKIDWRYIRSRYRSTLVYKFTMAHTDR